MSEKSPSLGLDLGGSNLRAALVSRNGAVLSESRSKVGPAPTPDGVLSQALSLIKQLLSQAQLDLDDLNGIGMGVAAQVRGSSGIIAAAPNLGWSEVPLGPLLSDALGRPVRLVNDLDAIAWGETLFGSAQGHDNVLVVYCGTGVGGGLVLGGRPYHGASGAAGEIGHLKVRPADGAPCGCGGTGCLEAYLGGKNLSRRLERAAAQDWPELAQLAGGQAIHPGLVEMLHERGDSQALALWRELSQMLGDVLANSITLLNLSAVVLGGTVLYGCPTLHRMAVEVALERILPVAGESLQFLADELGDRAGIIGAACLDQSRGEA